MDRRPEGADLAFPRLRSSADALAVLVDLLERGEAPGWRFLDSSAGGRLDLGPSVWPLVDPKGIVLGVVTRDPDTTSPVDELIRALLDTVVLLVATERRHSAVTSRADRAEADLYVDVLTGLANRRGWEQALQSEDARSRRSGNAMAIAVLDLDDLKAVNDRDGHLAGDMLLRAAASQLRTSIREEDVAARLGGDEFAVLAVDWDDTESVEVLADRLTAALDAAGVRASLGIAVHRPGDDVKQTFDAADRTMYDQKRERRRNR